ncbi:MAG: ankyrin repeat protein/uncharacterized membrane protein YhaH (DUF805 family) [Enterobacterales bacterium]|jgi:ankyrin repeat protein/uncharacterized membrane protein YhaH (DUF805 family)
MKKQTSLFEKVLNWLSLKGRINRKDYWLCHVIPALVVLSIGRFLSEFIMYFALFILISGMAKRYHDTNIQIGSKFKTGFGCLWVIIVIVVVPIAFIMFLGGISGLGNMDLIEGAGMVLLLPVLPILLAPLIVGLLPGSAEINRHGPPASIATKTESTESNNTNTGSLQSSFGIKKLFKAFGILLAIAVVVSLVLFLIQREHSLIRAIVENNKSEVALLLESGDDPNQTTLLGSTALGVALHSRYDSTEISILLLDFGADPNKTTTWYREGDYLENLFGLRKPRKDKYTPLMIAIRESSPIVVEKLIEKGVDVNLITGSTYGLSPLRAAMGSDIEKAKILLNSDVDLSLPENEKIIEEAILALLGDDELLELLLSKNVSYRQLQLGIEWIIPDGGKFRVCSKSTTASLNRLKTAANSLAGKQAYQINSHLSDAIDTIESTTTFTQRKFINSTLVKATGPSRYYKNKELIRSGPDESFEVIDNLKKDQIVEVMARVTDTKFSRFSWFQIRYENNKLGYVEGNQISAIDDCIGGMY